jgi:hypothetical protein
MVKLLEYGFFIYLVYIVLRSLLKPILKNGTQPQQPSGNVYNNYNEYNRRPSGETSIISRPDNQAKDNSDVESEYIDYKEVK